MRPLKNVSFSVASFIALIVLSVASIFIGEKDVSLNDILHMER
ncbi:hypothetical protein [Bacillus cereus]